MLSLLSVSEPVLPPVARHAAAMAAILVVPPLCRRISLPPVVGLLLAGIALGPHGLNVLLHNAEAHQVIAEYGKLLLMFFVGLEIDLALFQKTRSRSLVFGLVTFTLPLLAGVVIGLVAGYSVVAAFLIGSLIASHTLLAYPVLVRCGVVRNEAVTVTVGATIFTDILSLLILALCVPIHQSGFSPTGLLLALVELAIYVPLVIYGLSALGRKLVGWFGDSDEVVFIVLILLLSLTAAGAEIIRLEGIVGAFLAGLALNRAVRNTPAKEKLEFLGNTLFVPVFFVTTGFLIDLTVFGEVLVGHTALVLSVVGALFLAKWAAAQLAGVWFGYGSAERLTMWSLTLPQVAATLASAVVGYQSKNAQGERLIDAKMLNTVLVLMLITSIVGPILTRRWAPRIAPPRSEEAEPSKAKLDEAGTKTMPAVNPSG